LNPNPYECIEVEVELEEVEIERWENWFDEVGRWKS